MCGKTEQLVKIETEGTTLDVCKACSRFGKIVRAPKKIYSNKPRTFSKNNVLSQTEQIIVADYYVRIKNARESKGLKQNEVATEIGEKESLYNQLERGHKRPSIPTAKKLEKYFKITLIEEFTNKIDATIAKAPMGKQGLTIGDMIRMKLKK